MAENRPNPGPVVLGDAGQPRQAPQSPHAVPATPLTPDPERDSDGKLTRKGMEDAIKNGGGVLAGGLVHTHISTLPTAAELAKGDAKKEAEVLAELDVRQRALDAERSKLTQKK